MFRNLAVVAMVSTLSGSAAMAAGGPLQRSGSSREYFTEEEVDYLRDAQGLAMRVPAIIRLANIRLVVLSMKTKSKEDTALEKRIAEIRAEIAGKPAPKARPGENPKNPPEEIARPYLNDLTRTELLRGYIEAIEEIGRVIDDAYREKQEVRGVLEQFEKFLNSTNPLLRRFQSKNSDEFQAILDARSETQDSLENAQDALKQVPKTEKSTKP
jgi:hypothetical protein